jgi:ribosomal protein S18 acetylase RimI-like enzyme
MRTPFSRAQAPGDVDLGTDEYVVRRHGGFLVARVADSDEDWVADDGSRFVLLRAYQWDPRRRFWALVGRLNGIWFAGQRRFEIADLEIFSGYRSHGHGSRLLVSSLDIAQRLGAGTVTGNLSAVDDVDRLKLWYARFGFAVGPPRKAGMVASVAWMPPSSVPQTGAGSVGRPQGENAD